MPATLGALLVISLGVNYFLAFTTGLVAAIVLGVLVETLIIRRFFKAPRLILTVATIGLSQVLVGAGLFLAQAFGQDFQSNRLDPPFDGQVPGRRHDLQRQRRDRDGGDAVAFIALAALLRLSNIGVAVRGSAERADRASTLGIPVRRLHTIVWMVATVLAFLAMFLRAGAVGLPDRDVLGPTFLLQALGRGGDRPHGALRRHRRRGHRPRHRRPGDDLPARQQARVQRRRPVRRHAGRAARHPPSEQRTGSTPIGLDVAGGSRGPADPPRAARLPEVDWRGGCCSPRWARSSSRSRLWLDESRINLAAIIVIFGIVGVSLVVLTGWAGQVSLGQMAFVGVGAAVGGWVTDYTETDLAIALLAGGAAGALAAVVVGYPALRRRGLTLAVSTLAFALFVSSFLLNQELFGENGEPPRSSPGTGCPGPHRPPACLRPLRHRDARPASTSSASSSSGSC